MIKFTVSFILLKNIVFLYFTAIKRVTQSFDAKIACDARTYSYMLPTFAFSPDSKIDELYRIPGNYIICVS